MAPVKITPITSDGGAKWGPQLSPDGEKVAYQWAPANDNMDVYVKGLGPGTRPLRLTEDPARDCGPVWSPDGRQIAFVRHLEDGPALYTVPWPGGQERRLIQLTRPTRVDPSVGLGNLSWSPDGDWLAFDEKPSEDEPSRIVRLALATLEKETLTSPPRDTLGDSSPRFSPDGTQVAFVRSAKKVWGIQDVWVQPLGGGEARQLTFERYQMVVGPLAWTPDGDEILFTVFYPLGTILRVNLVGGEPQRLVGIGEGAIHPSIRGSRMVYRQQTTYPEDIWRMPGRAAAASERTPKKLIARAGGPSYSPDGRKIAFTSNRAGSFDIWACESDGANPVQLTDLGAFSSSPHWSPDGRRIVFDSNEAGDYNLYVIDVEGAVPRRLTQEPSQEGGATWSRDGRWIYFFSDRSGSGQIWKIPAEGGAAVQVTHGGGVAPPSPHESWDGLSLYYRRPEPPGGIWRVPLAGGEETEVVAGSGPWALSRSGIYFTTSGPEPNLPSEAFTIRYLDLESGEVTELYRSEGAFYHFALAVSPDEEWILHSQEPIPTAELMLVENFR